MPIYNNIHDIPKNKYMLTYLDWPWWWPKREKGTKFGGGCPYPVMKMDEIFEYCDIMKEKIPDNAVCFSWINTNSNSDANLAKRLLTFERMGFRNTGVAFIWVKTTKNGTIRKLPGRYQSNSTEQCYLGVKGSISRYQAVKLWDQVRDHQLLKHSEKPELFRNEIDRIYPDIPRLEMFARKTNNGWSAFGNEV